ncbi:MAG: hypothetical protein RLZZ383_2464 [Pseudomonadota bacterium]
MAVRVRKLAKDLQRTPAAVVGMLHALGQSRYRSADDMIPAALEESVRRAFSRGLRPVEVVLVEAPPGRPQAAEHAPKPPEDDLMSRLVPGVSRPGVRVAPVPAVPAPRPAPVGAPAPERGTRGMGTTPAPLVPVVVSGGLEGELRRIETERAALDSHARRLASEAALLASERLTFAEEQAAWADRIASLDEERASLASLGEALAAERAALDAERAALTALADRARGHGGIELATLLVERGLRGVDEQERALGALAASRTLRDVLPSLRVTRVEDVRRVLAERLVLVDASAPEAGGIGGVAVAPERAEIPPPALLAQRLSQLSERLLLAGLRRVVLVGGRPTWHRLVRDGLDPRVELRTVAAAARDGAQAANDVERGDLVVLAGVDVSTSAQAIYNASRAEVVHVAADTLSELLGSWIAKL